MFCGNDSLLSIVVDDANEFYCSVDGMLFDKAKAKLIVCPGGAVDVTIPAGVTIIGHRAFYRCYGLTSVTIPEGVTTIGEYAFDWCESLAALTLPKSVTYVGDGAFASCSNLKSVCFAGDMPETDGMIYGEDWLISENATTYVREGTSGWGEVPGEWCGRPIKWWAADDPSPIPAVGDDATAEEVFLALNGSGDEKLIENILQTCETEGDAAGVELYNAYRAWAGTVKGRDGEPTGLQAVRDSATAWTSFALDSSTLLERNPTDEDLKVEAFAPSDEDGKFDFTVRVEGVTVGSKALAENLKRTFGLEGAAELVPSAFDEANVDIEYGEPVGGRLKFTAEPADKEAKSFFMKMTIR